MFDSLAQQTRQFEGLSCKAWAPFCYLWAVEKSALKTFLDAQVAMYNQADFITDDPISVPHRFTKKEDIEIIGFLSATIAWGQRKTIVKNALLLAELMENDPFAFVIGHQPKDLKRFKGFVHRTFNEADIQYFVFALQQLYLHQGGLESIFTSNFSQETDSRQAIHQFKRLFFSFEHLPRTEKHVSDPMKGSGAKRLNMFLRWMVRQDDAGVDFGLWKQIPMSKLSIPLDVHTGNVSRKLGLLERSQNDSKAVVELDASLRALDPEDPVKYDFALFGLGVNGQY